MTDEQYHDFMDQKRKEVEDSSLAKRLRVVAGCGARSAKYGLGGIARSVRNKYDDQGRDYTKFNQYLLMFMLINLRCTNFGVAASLLSRLVIGTIAWTRIPWT